MYSAMDADAAAEYGKIAKAVELSNIEYKTRSAAQLGH
jgi:hypothetical protein